MTAKSFVAGCVVLCGILTVGRSNAVNAQAVAQTIGTVRIPQAVVANGQPLAAGSYSLRLSSDAVTPVVGQSPEASRWIEFVQGGQVRGRELAVVVTTAEAREISDGKNPPSAGAPRVQTLRGGDYLRLWVPQGNTHYLVHLSAAAR